ncbi:MAG: hypothetical protein QOC73_1200 [Actinomycetota bacterium]|nr:hypothetical protein [Actinomycetota bacterium]
MASGPTYYVSTTGSDSNNGTSAATPWKTIGKVNATALGTGGATVLFNGGQNFAGCLLFDLGEGGTSTSPLTINSYGTGRATITCKTAAASAIWIHDTGGFSISNLNLVNTRGARGGYYGIEMSNDLAGGVKETYFRFDSLDVANFSVAGIAMHAEPTDKNPATGFSDVRITNVTAHGNRDAGIESWSNRDVTTNPTAYNFDTVYIGSTSAYSNPGIAGKGSNSGSGIAIGEAQNVTIEYSSAHDNGTSNNNAGGGPVGIWVYQTANAVIQFNESYNNSKGAGAADGGGFDLDGGVTNSTVQYNYSHNNDGAGVLIFQYAGGRPHQNNTVRYNVSVNDARKGNYGAITTGSDWSGHPLSNLNVYGNTIYMNATTVDSSAVQSGLRFWDGGSAIKVYNNLVYTTGSAVRLLSEERDNPGLVLDYNSYWAGGNATTLFVWNGGVPQYTEGGATTYTSFAAFKTGAGQEAHGSFVDPQLTTPGSMPTLTPTTLSSLTGYELQSTSPVANTGVTLSSVGISSGPHDFYGDAVPAGTAFSMGAHDR